MSLVATDYYTAGGLVEEELSSAGDDPQAQDPRESEREK